MFLWFCFNLLFLLSFVWWNKVVYIVMRLPFINLYKLMLVILLLFVPFTVAQYSGAIIGWRLSLLIFMLWPLLNPIPCLERIINAYINWTAEFSILRAYSIEHNDRQVIRETFCNLGERIFCYLIDITIATYRKFRDFRQKSLRSRCHCRRSSFRWCIVVSSGIDVVQMDNRSSLKHNLLLYYYFLRPLAQSRRLKIKQLRLDMALTQIWTCS